MAIWARQKKGGGVWVQCEPEGLNFYKTGTLFLGNFQIGSKSLARAFYHGKVSSGGKGHKGLSSHSLGLHSKINHYLSLFFVVSSSLWQLEPLRPSTLIFFYVF